MRTFLFYILLFLGASFFAQPYTQNLTGPVTSGSPVYTSGVINSSQKISGLTGVTYIGSVKVHLTDGFSTGNNFDQQLHAKIDNNTIVVADMTNANFGNYALGYSLIAQWQRWEMGISLPDINPDNLNMNINTFLNTGTGDINPYDPDKIKIQCVITDPDGITIYTRYAFYFVDFQRANSTTAPYDQIITQTPILNGNYPFRIRFAPPHLGIYSFKINIFLNGSTTPLTAPEYQFSGIFNCAGLSGSGGTLSMGGQNNSHLQDANGNMFFAMGRNIAYAGQAYQLAHPEDFNDQRQAIYNLRLAGGNFVRTRMNPWSNEIEWEELGVYGSNTSDGNVGGVPFYRQWQAKQLDDNLHYCEDYEGVFYTLKIPQMYMYFTPFDDQAFGTTGAYGNNFGWSINPYNTKLGLSSPGDFLTDPTAMSYIKRKLFYIMARWGYSPNIGVISLVNETDHFPGYNSSSVISGDMYLWLKTMAEYLKSGDNGQAFYPRHLLTSDYADFPKSPDDGTGANNFDIHAHHNYSTARNSIHQRHDEVLSSPGGNSINPGGPFIWGELGAGQCGIHQPEYCDDSQVHNAIWGTSMNSSSIGSGLYWWDWLDQMENPPGLNLNIYPPGSGIKHESNFTALKAFFMDNVSGVSEPIANTFATEVYESTWHHDQVLEKNRNIEWIFNLNIPGSPATKGFGWVHNSDYEWLNLQGVSNCSFSYPYLECVDPDNPDDYEHDNPYPDPPHSQSLDLGGFQGGPNKSFIIETWSCYGNGGLLSTTLVNSNIFGTITIPFFTVGAFVGDPAGDPDYAFKIYKSDLSFRLSTNNNMDADTIAIDSANSCIQVSGYLSEAVKGTHKWDFGNGITSNEENPLACYNKPGTYAVTHSFVDTTGASINLNSDITIIFKTDSDIKSDPATTGSNTSLIYPNPFTNSITINSHKNIDQIVIKNILGVEVYNMANVHNKAVTINLPPDNAPGMYFVLLNYTDGESVTKVITKQ